MEGKFFIFVSHLSVEELEKLVRAQLVEAALHWTIEWNYFIDNLFLSIMVEAVTMKHMITAEKAKFRRVYFDITDLTLVA